MTAAFNGASGTRPYLFLCSFDRDAAAQPVIKHLVGLQLAGCSWQGGEAGQTQLETRRRGFGRGRRRRRSRPLQDTETQKKTRPTIKHLQAPLVHDALKGTLKYSQQTSRPSFS